MMKRVASILLVLVMAALAFAAAAPAEERWRVIADTGDSVAVAAAAKRRATRFAVRVRMTGEPKKAEVHTVVTCSKVVLGGPEFYSRRDTVTLTAPVIRELILPVPYPENCGVTAIAIRQLFSPRGSITVEILARCIVQTFPAAKGKCI